ncbi:formylmethanofuran dehydrogenase subunit C [Ideonella sp. A 288]|uniref:formylmethanofuran dehydrogenase subunit C n=1 Tax=Ideonella sp. A 288 TaxID=1962181 RepID=UPI000B4BE1A5|nr:formylmethanofuran dehydrogenase subunit C [Ideonella sp. A 288]
MSGWRLILRQPPALRLDLTGLTPTALAALTAADVERLPIGHGNRTLPLGEFFSLQPGADDTLRLEGDLSCCDRVGWQMAGGQLVVDGSVGHYAGAGMTSGTLHVRGHAGLLAACEMAGGRLTVDGDVGDFAASTLPGSMDGMRGGTLVVAGNAGARFGDRMRRGTAVVFGHAGDFLASRMVAGTIALGGTAGAHLGYGMRRGSLVLASDGPPMPPPPTFVPAVADALVFWQLLSRDLARHGGPFAQLPKRRIERHLGDLAAGGKGELITVC